MDVHCSGCREPWDIYHLQQDAIFETDLTEAEAEAWTGLPLAQKLNERYREKFKAAGWEFGRSVVNVIRCPCCPPDTKPDIDNAAIKEVLEDVLGDDEDGLAASYEDYGL